MDKKSSRPVDKENLVQAVIIADTYNDNFSPASNSNPVCLMPLANRPMLDYTLECLSAAGVQEVILFCSSFADKIREFVRLGRWGDMAVNVVVSEGCRSVGDAMRDLDAKALIRTDFILLSASIIGSLQLLPILDKHKKIQKTDKGAAMTVVYKECGDKALHPSDEIYIGLDNKTDRILYHNKTCDNYRVHVPSNARLHVPLEVLLDVGSVDFRANLMDTGVSICSVSVPPLFSDNFDFQTREDFIRGLLMNEEILASTLYAHLLSPPDYAAQVNHWCSYHTIGRDIMHRWTYPQVPGGFIDDMYSYQFGNIYLQSNVSMDVGSKLLEDVVVGGGSSVGANTRISSSVVGKSSRISSDVLIKNSHLFSDVIVEAGSRVEYSVLGTGCIVGAGAVVKSCILGPGVIVPPHKELHKLRLQSTPQNKDEEGVGEKAFEYRGCSEEGGSEDSFGDGGGEDEGEWIGLEPTSRVNWLEEDVESDQEDEVASHTSSAPDDTNLFFSEVVDSLSRGLEEGLACDNLVLEVNSSRYAYNVSLREVNYHVSRAVLSLTSSQQLKWEQLGTTVSYFLPLLTNYVKNSEAMSDCLSAIEDVCEEKEEMRGLCVKLLHLLYDKDVLAEEAILQWHSTPRDNSPSALSLRKQVIPFIRWLQEADEQSDSD